MPWFMMIGLPNGVALLRVVERVLVGGTGDAEGLGADRGAGGLERRHRRLLRRRCDLPSLAGPGELRVELVLAAKQAAAGHADVVEDDLGGVRRPDAVLLVLLALREARRAGRNDEARLTAALSEGSTVATTTWTSAMPPLVIHAFVPLMTHSSLASS